MQLANFTPEEQKLALSEIRRNLDEAERIFEGNDYHATDAERMTRLHFHLNEGSRQLSRIKVAARRQLWYAQQR
jgi:hypothetical protein